MRRARVGGFYSTLLYNFHTLFKHQFGPAFRVNAKHVQGYLNTLQQEPNPDDCVNLDSSTTPLWDEAKLVALQAQLDAGGGKTKVVGTDGNEYEISNELVSIVRRTEKINSKFVFFGFCFLCVIVVVVLESSFAFLFRVFFSFFFSFRGKMPGCKCKRNAQSLDPSTMSV